MAITTFVKEFTAGTIHAPFEGRVGCLIEVTRPIRVTHLGRLVGPGFTSKAHGLRLCRQGTNVAVCSATLNTTGGTVGVFKYAALTEGPTLITPGRYDLVSDEQTGGDFDPWYNSDTVLTRYGGAASVLAAVFYDGFDPGDAYRLDRWGGHSFGPVDFKYSPFETAELITSVGAGTPNTAFAGWQGLIFQTLGKRLRVTALGRIGIVGNTLSHNVRLVNHHTGVLVASAVVDLTGGVLAEGFVYADLVAAVTLEPWTHYALWSQETTGGDARYVNVAVTSHTALGSEVATVTGSAASTNGLTADAGASPGSIASGPVSLLCEVLEAPAYVQAVPQSAGQALLAWPHVEGASSYRLERSSLPGSGFVAVGTPSGLQATAQLTGTGERYFRVIPELLDGTDGPASPVAQIRVRPTLTREPQRLASGLILRETLDDRLGESAGLWDVVAAPSLVSFAPSQVVAAEITDFTRDGTARQGQVLQLQDGRWFGYYDGAMPDTELASDADRRNWASPRFQMSTDKGLSWQKYGPTDIFTREREDYNVTAGHAMGHFGVFGGRFIATLLRGAAGDEALLTGPFLGDQFEADSPYGPWEWVGETAPSGGGAGSFDDETNYPGSVVQSGSTYYLFLSQFKFSPSFSYSMSIASGPSPTGPWSVPTAALSIPGLTAGISHIVENLKVFYHSGLARWVMLGNAGDGTSGTGLNRAWFSTSITDWSAATWINFQKRSPLDALLALGVPSPVYREEGLPVVEPDGSVPFTFDGHPLDGENYYRRVYYGQLEQSKNALEFNDTSSTVSSFPFEVDHSEFVAEFSVEIDSSTGGGFIAFDCLMDEDGENGYRVKLAAGGDISLIKVTAGVESTVQAGSGTNATTKVSHRIMVTVKDRYLTATLDGETHVTGAVAGSGERVAFTAKNVHCRVRLFHMRRDGSVRLRGLASGARVVLRGAGSIPLAITQADSSGYAEVAHGHFPAKSIEVDGYEFPVADGVWGGDEFG